MANEIGQHVDKVLIGTPYALIRNSINQVWDVANDEFTAYVSANLGDYDLPMTEQGAGSSDFWAVSFPVHANMIPGVYTILIKDEAGGIAESNPFLGSLNDFQWDAAFEVNPNLVHADIDFNVDDPNSQDEYNVEFLLNGFGVTAAQITGTPTITVTERDDSDLIATTNMTQVGTTHKWKYDEGADKVTLGEGYFIDIVATVFGVSRTYREIISRDR